MSEMNKPLAAAMRAMAHTALTEDEKLGFLRNAHQLEPTDDVVARQIRDLEAKQKTAIGYVAIERVVTIGTSNAQIEGRIYAVQPDQSLKPLNGQELLAFDTQHPNFIKNWRLEK
jgi:hypothetical protein